MNRGAGAARQAGRLATALLALLLLALALQGARGLWSPDEGRYVDVALQMLDTGDWIHPRLHHEVAHFTKPPLTYWALASSIGGLGRTEFAARLPNALAWLAAVLLVFAAARHLEPARPWLPPLVYATFLLPFLAANVVTTDTLLAATVALYGYGFLAAGLATSARERAIGRWLLWLGAALAFLAKGPPGLLPLAGLLAFAWTRRHEQPPGATYFRAAPLLIAAVLAGAWYAKVAWDRPDLLRYFLVEEVWNRVASDATHRNAHWYAPLSIYLPTVLLGSLPWSWPLLRRAGRALAAPRASLAATWAAPDARRLLLWIGVPLVVFVLAKSRLPLYLLPLFQPLAFVVARGLRDWRPPRALPLLLLAWFTLLLALRWGASVLDRPEDDRALAAAVAALGFTSIGEIAFVDTAPRYGLSFYLGAEVERIGLPDAPLPPQSETLRSELADDEGCRLFLVESARAAALRHALPGASREVGAVGGYRGFVADDDRCTLAPR